MLLNYAHGRSQLPSPTITATTGGQVATPRTLWFAIQGCNPIGCNLLSNPVQATIGANQKAIVTLPAILDGESWDSFVLSASETNNPSSFVAIARIEVGTTLELTTDEHLNLSDIVLNPSALPTASLIPGMRRGVSSLAQVFEYNPSSLEPQNNQTILSAAPAPGNWLIVGGFSTVVARIDDRGGCAQNVRSIDETSVSLKTYNCNGSSGEGFRFWLINDSDDAIAAGKRVMIAVTLNEMPRSGLFEGLLRCVFRGYVNTITGVLRIEDANGDPMKGIDTEVLFENQKTDLMLEDDLQPNEAYAIDIFPNFTPEQLDNQILNGSLIKINLGLAAQAGAYVEGGSAWGNRIYPEYDRGLVVPQSVGAKCLKRSGLVNSRSFLAVSPTHVLGLAQNTLNQPLYINSNGSVYLKPLDEPQDSTEAIRAKIGTAAGVSSPSPWSEPVTFSAGKGIRVTCNYPSNGTNATVRSSYPDQLIAGNTSAEFNPPFVVIYVRSTINNVATIKKFDGYLVIDAMYQPIAIDNWNNGETISSVPVANEDFSLFEPIGATAEPIGAGTIPAGTIEVCFAYEYDGAQVTNISHDPLDDCIHTSTLTMAEVESASQYWTEPVSTREDLRNVPRSRVVPFQARYVSETQSAWWYNAASTEEESERVIRPVWRTPEQPGRWIETASNRILTPDEIPTGTAGIGDIAIVLKDDTEDPDHGKVYRFENGEWIPKSILRGRRGIPGEKGTIAIFESVPDESIEGEIGTIGFVLNDASSANGEIYRKDAGGWVKLGKLGEGDGGTTEPEIGTLYNDAIALNGSTYTLDASKAKLFRLTIEGDDPEIEVSNAGEKTQLTLMLDWNDQAAPQSLRFTSGFEWLDRPLAPDFRGNSQTYRIDAVDTGSGLITTYYPAILESLEPETKSLLDRLTGYYSNRQQIEINRLIRRLKEAEILNQATLYVFAAGTIDDALQDWIQDSRLNTANPFDAWRGITTDSPMETNISYRGTRTIALCAANNTQMTGVDLGAEIVNPNDYDQGSQLMIRDLGNQAQGRTLGRSNDAAFYSANLFEPAIVAASQYDQSLHRLFANGVESASSTQSAVNTPATIDPDFILGGMRRYLIGPPTQTPIYTETIVSQIVRQYSALFASRNSLTPYQHEVLARSLKFYLSTLPQI